MTWFFGNGLTHAQEATNSDALFFGVSDGRGQLSSDRENSPYYQDKERGWFWYEDPAQPEEENLRENRPSPAPKSIPSKPKHKRQIHRQPNHYLRSGFGKIWSNIGTRLLTILRRKM